MTEAILLLACISIIGVVGLLGAIYNWEWIYRSTGAPYQHIEMTESGTSGVVTRVILLYSDTTEAPGKVQMRMPIHLTDAGIYTTI